jgi:hypothetical protein
MSRGRRYQIVLPVPAAERLDALARTAGEYPSTLAASYVTDGIARATGEQREPRPQRPTAAGVDGERPPWLEPWGGDPAWRADMWGQIVALYGRYPRALGALKDGWWNDTQHTETLCALAIWRAQIDETANTNTREELHFQAQLTDYHLLLTNESGGVGKNWKPDAPPDEWTNT